MSKSVEEQMREVMSVEQKIREVLKSYKQGVESGGSRADADIATQSILQIIERGEIVC